MNPDKRQEYIYELTSSKFYDDKHYIGFIHEEPEPYDFMNIEREYTLQRAKFDRDEFNFLKLMFKLTDVQRTYERSPYTIITLLSDIGGFNGLLLYIPSSILSFYSIR